jgi:leucyl/phenylalanyl-tRNA--protein transferase
VLTPDILVTAYATGIFPMAESAEETKLFWVDPDRRGVIPLESFHVPDRLRRSARKSNLEIRCDTAFEAVIRGCAMPSETRPKTWINEEIIKIYHALFVRGLAHSVEAWRNDELVGGLYGVSLNRAFFGESMFSRVSDASKIALVHLVARLIRGGFTLLDTQFVTRHLERFGAVEISRSEYRRRLASALMGRAQFQPDLPEDPFDIVQSSTHTS